MKLLYCPECKDVKRLVADEWRLCKCGKSGSQYNEDHVTATVGGIAKVFGIGNPFFSDEFNNMTIKEKRKFRKKYYGQPDTDCWWGDYDGEQQLFHIKSPMGVRLKIKILPINNEENIIKIVDRRKYFIDKKANVKQVQVPSNTSYIRSNILTPKICEDIWRTLHKEYFLSDTSKYKKWFQDFWLPFFCDKCERKEFCFGKSSTTQKYIYNRACGEWHPK